MRESTSEAASYPTSRSSNGVVQVRKNPNAFSKYTCSESAEHITVTLFSFHREKKMQVGTFESKLPRCAHLSSNKSARHFFFPQLLIKFLEMTHLPCRDVNPSMPCFVEIKKKKMFHSVWVFTCSRMCVLQIRSLIMYLGNDLPIKRHSISSLRCHFNTIFHDICFQREALLL